MSKRGLGRGLQALIPTMESIDNAAVNEIPLTQIHPNQSQPRKNFDAEKMEELVASVREHGVLQPIILRHHADGYEIVAGERRWRAAKQAGLKTIPAVVMPLTDSEVTEIALIENLQREDLNPLEEAMAYKRLMEEFGLTQEVLAKRIGKSRSMIANSVRLLTLAEDLQQYVAQGVISVGHAKVLLGIEQLELRRQVAQAIIDDGLTVRETEDLIRRLLRKDVPRGTKKHSPTREPAIIEVEEQLKRAFGTQVKVKPGKNKGRIEIEYYSNEDLERILELVAGEKI